MISVPLPGMAVPVYFPDRHTLTAREHQLLAEAKVLGFDELDELARPHLRDTDVKRGNVQALGPRSYPLAYVVGPGLVAVAVGRHHATHGGWVRPGGDEGPRAMGYDRRADVEAERDRERRLRTSESALDWDERVLDPMVYLGRAR